MDKSSKSFLIPALLIAGMALLLAHIFFIYHSYPFIIADDTFISLRYAERLLEGKGLTWNDGEYVEGYSNLLWILLNAALGALGVPLPSAPQLLGAIATLLTPLAFFWHAREAKLKPWALVVGVAGFAVTAPVAVWAVAGMETPLAMLLFAWAAVLCYRLLDKEVNTNACVAGVTLALLCLLRPEGPLYTVAIAAALMMFSVVQVRRRVRMAAIISAIPFVVYALQLCFRLYYYGQWVPNTVLAKVAFTPQRLVSGFSYIVNALFFFLPLLLYAAINYRLAYKKHVEITAVRFGLFLLTIVGILSAAILIEGGDFFPCFRAFMPLVPLIILMLMHGLSIGLTYAPVKKELVFLGYILACHLWQQWAVDMHQLPESSRWIESAKSIGLALKEKYAGRQPTIAVFAAGAVPFYSELPALDIFGLTDPYLAVHRKEITRFGEGIVGHELFDGNYIASKKPDILIFEIPGFYPICNGFQKECGQLLPDYKPGVLHIPDADVKIWLRKDSDKLK